MRRALVASVGIAWACAVAVLMIGQVNDARRLKKLEDNQIAMRERLEATIVQLKTSRETPLDRGGPLPIPSEPISVVGAVVVGSETARVAIIEFTDFYCPYCRRHAQETAPLILRDFIDVGRVRYMMWQLPLERLHPKALELAVAAECANRQGKFWEMHDWLFDSVRAPRGPDVERKATLMGLNSDRFKTCREDSGVSTQISKGVSAASAMGISSTPTFLLGIIQPAGTIRVLKRLSGAQPYPVFKGAIESLLSSSSGNYD